VRAALNTNRGAVYVISSAFSTVNYGFFLSTNSRVEPAHIQLAVNCSTQNYDYELKKEKERLGFLSYYSISYASEDWMFSSVRFHACYLLWKKL
jgi:hypothetical protein